MKPMAIDLFCGCFGWSQGWLEMGGRVVGFEIEHLPHHGPVPAGAELVLQDVLTLHGSQFKDASLILASPPCQAYSYRAMPWKRAKALPPPSNELFDACFRIQREASEAAGHHIPMVVENVQGAQPWVGRAKAHWGSRYLWGDVPLLPERGCSVKQRGSGRAWFTDNLSIGHYSSKSAERRAWTAQVSRIEFELSSYVAKCYYPSGETLHAIRNNDLGMAATDNCGAYR